MGQTTSIENKVLVTKLLNYCTYYIDNDLRHRENGEFALPLTGSHMKISHIWSSLYIALFKHYKSRNYLFICFEPHFRREAINVTWSMKKRNRQCNTGNVVSLCEYEEPPPPYTECA